MPPRMPSTDKMKLQRLLACIPDLGEIHDALQEFVGRTQNEADETITEQDWIAARDKCNALAVLTGRPRY